MPIGFASNVVISSAIRKRNQDPGVLDSLTSSGSVGLLVYRLHCVVEIRLVMMEVRSALPHRCSSFEHWAKAGSSVGLN